VQKRWCELGQQKLSDEQQETTELDKLLNVGFRGENRVSRCYAMRVAMPLGRTDK
jgi:hypothetical protein